MTSGPSRGIEPREGALRAPPSEVPKVIEIPPSPEATAVPEQEGGLAPLAIDAAAEPHLVGLESAVPSSSMVPSLGVARGPALMSPDASITLKQA